MLPKRWANAVWALALAVMAMPASVAAGPAIVIEADSGRVLHHEQAFELWSPASLTKLMTAYVTFRAIEAGELDMRAPVVMSANAAANPPSKMGYRVGASMTVDNALKMVIIRSANDVAVALGEAVAGSEAAFVARMNAQAERLGMTDTNFVNPHGLHDPDQYSTARDFAILARAIRTQYPEHERYFAAEAIRTGDRVTASYNLLLGRFEGADGMKTGFVCASGFNLAASATRDGRTLISVVMGTASQKERAEVSARLLEQGFAAPAPADAPTLASLSGPPDADGRPADLRDTVCTAEARAARWDGRTIEGYIAFDTPLIRELTREPVAVTAGLGGASGQSRAGFVLAGTVVTELPLPKLRPEREAVADQADLDRYRLRPGFEVPVPRPRPESG